MTAGSLTTFDQNTKPSLSDLDDNFTALWAAMTALVPGTNILIVAGTDSSGNPTATFSLPDPLTIGSIDAQTLLKGKGRADGVVPSTGYIGEVLTFSLASASAVTMTPSGGTTPVTNICSGTLTAGNWLLLGNVIFNPSGQTVSSMIAAISQTSATQPNDFYLAEDVRTATVPVATPHLPCAPRYLSLSASSTVYLIAQAVCGGAISAYGQMFAVRLP